jgi:hypothetical protein
VQRGVVVVVVEEVVEEVVEGKAPHAPSTQER